MLPEQHDHDGSASASASPATQGESSQVKLQPRLTRRGRPRKIFRYLEGLEGSLSSSAVPPLHTTTVAQTAASSLVSAEAEARESEDKHDKKRRKVSTACVFCRRSHMMCDDQRPCKRCCHRGIGHLCADGTAVVAAQTGGECSKQAKSNLDTSISTGNSNDDGDSNDCTSGSDAESSLHSHQHSVNQARREQQIGLPSEAHDRTSSEDSSQRGHQSKRSDVSVLLSYLQEASEEPSHEATPGELAEPPHLTSWTHFIRGEVDVAGSTAMQQHDPSPTPFTSQALAGVPTSMAAISLPQLLFHKSPPHRPETSSPAASVPDPHPLEELQRLLATLGGAPLSPSSDDHPGSTLLTPSEYAALRRFSSQPTTPFHGASEEDAAWQR